MKLENIGNTTLISSSSVGVVAFINDYATIISLFIGLVGLLVGILFHILALIDRRRQLELDAERIEKLEILDRRKYAIEKG